MPRSSTLAHSQRFTPKYVNLARDLVKYIASQGLGVGDRLGTEHELGQQYGLSRVTVRQALELLESEGYVSRKRARGTFVAREVPPAERIGVQNGRVLLVCSNEQKAHCDEDSAFRSVLRSIEQSLAQHDFTVQIMSVGQEPCHDRQRLNSILRNDELSGLLTIGPCLDPYADLFDDIHVVTTCSFYATKFSWVGDDVILACHQSVTHLLQQGHRRIAMICGNWIDGQAFACFAKGMRQALHEADVPADRTLMVHNYPGESLEALASEVLSRTPPPTAIFCENWRVCQAVLKAAASKGLAIPDDLSILGYGLNVQLMKEPVPITAYVPDAMKIGELAADLLAGLLSGKVQMGQPILVRGALVEGRSVRVLVE